MRCHGALLDVQGVGVLLLGPSGIGKSECAVELVRRGSRLVADDVVELSRDGEGRLIGAAPERIRHYMEIQGLGIVFVPDLFGRDAVLDQGGVDLVCHLERTPEAGEVERVGIDRAEEEIEGVKIPCVRLPARHAGSMATVIEVAARDHRLRCGGVNAAARLDARLRSEMRRS
jgi:HPr kinase/phosphorylase